MTQKGAGYLYVMKTLVNSIINQVKNYNCKKCYKYWLIDMYW